MSDQMHKEVLLMGALARAAGYLRGISTDSPVLDDDPMDFIRRMREGAAKEADAATEALERWKGAPLSTPPRPEERT